MTISARWYPDGEREVLRQPLGGGDPLGVLAVGELPWGRSRGAGDPATADERLLRGAGLRRGRRSRLIGGTGREEHHAAGGGNRPQRGPQPGGARAIHE